MFLLIFPERMEPGHPSMATILDCRKTITRVTIPDANILLRAQYLQCSHGPIDRRIGRSALVMKLWCLLEIMANLKMELRGGI